LPTGTRASETAERKRRCVDAAVALAAEGGYDAVQMRDVAAKAEVALGTLYRHYASKDQLLLAAMLQQTETLRERIVQRPPRGETPSERVADVLRRASRALERSPNTTKAMLNAMSSEDESAVPVKAEIDTTLRAMIAEAIDGGGGERIDRFDDTVHVLGSVWFAELTYWTNGLSSASTMAENLGRAASLLLP
jgi:TetR/AcrR family transcriptional regulator, cholesterol catabolism regulator